VKKVAQARGPPALGFVSGKGDQGSVQNCSRNVYISGRRLREKQYAVESGGAVPRYPILELSWVVKGGDPEWSFIKGVRKEVGSAGRG